MSKRSGATPTLTESRAKRTPKPNPKYAVDYVAKIRISPDRKTEDGDSDSTPKPIKKVKPSTTPEPKKIVGKTNPQTPVVSRLSTLRNVPKRAASPSFAPKTTGSSGKTTPVSSKGSPTLPVAKTNTTSERKLLHSPSDSKVVSSSSDVKPNISVKRVVRNETVTVQKVSPATKQNKKVVNDEIRIVNINDIMKQSESKVQSSDEVKSVKKQKTEHKVDEIIDIEDEISVSSAIRPTRQRQSILEKVEVKTKPQVKTIQSPPIKGKQPSPIIDHKRKTIVNTQQNNPVKSTPIVIAKSQPSKNSPSSVKTLEHKEELGQVLAKRILRKVVKPSFSKPETPEKPKIRKPIDMRKIKKFTTFEKWSVLNFPQIQAQPARSVLCLSLIKLGNKIKNIKLPSSEWSYRITLQKINKENSDKGEIYTGDIEDCGIQEGDKGNYAPVNITFEKSSGNSKTPKRSVVFQNKSFSIYMDGKQSKLIGAPQYIYDLIEIQTLLHIVDQVDAFHGYVDQGDK